MDKRFLRAGVAGLAALLIGALMAPVGSTAQEAGDKDTVTVEARRTVDIEPDIGRITFGIRSKDASAEGAMATLTEKTVAVHDALGTAGFTEEELSTAGVNLRRTCISRCRDRDRDNDVRGYKATTGVRLETKALDRLGEAIDIAVGAGATSIRNLVFDVEDDDAAVQEALTQAMNFARSKAQTLAEAGDRTLGRALIIIEGNSRTPSPYAFDAAAISASVGSGSGGGQAFPIDPPTLDASARIEVTFELI